MKNIISIVAGIVTAFALASSVHAAVLFQTFESDTPATEFASGDFDPASPQQGFGHFVSEAAASQVQVVSTSTTPNGNPSGGVQVFSGTQSLKIDANAGANQLELEPSNFETLAIRSTLFYAYGDTGASVGGGRLFEVFADDTSAAGTVNVWALRVDENGNLFYETTGGGWIDTGTDVTHGQWNKFAISANAGTGLVNLRLNDIPVAGNIYHGTGDTIDQWNFTANNAAGTGAGVFYDNIVITDTFTTFIIPEPTSLFLLGLGGLVLRFFRRKVRA